MKSWSFKLCSSDLLSLSIPFGIESDFFFLIIRIESDFIRFLNIEYKVVVKIEKNPQNMDVGCLFW